MTPAMLRGARLAAHDAIAGGETCGRLVLALIDRIEAIDPTLPDETEDRERLFGDLAVRLGLSRGVALAAVKAAYARDMVRMQQGGYDSAPS